MAQGGITPTTAGLTEKVAEMQEQLDIARVLNMSLESEQLNLQKRAHQAKVDYDHIVQRCQALENENVLLKFQVCFMFDYYLFVNRVDVILFSVLLSCMVCIMDQYIHVAAFKFLINCVLFC